MAALRLHPKMHRRAYIRLRSFLLHGKNEVNFLFETKGTERDIHFVWDGEDLTASGADTLAFVGNVSF